MQENPTYYKLRFSKIETAKELWEAILKTFGGNESTKKTKRNQLRQQYAASNSHDTVCAYIASQSNGSQVKYEDITQVDEDDIKEMDIKWNIALLSIRANRFWKKTGKKITIQGSDVAGFDKSKLECFNYHKLGHFARECKAHRSQDRGRRESYKQYPKEEEPAPKALMAIDGIGWHWSYMANEEENHALVADYKASTEFALIARSSSSSKKEVYDDSYCSKSCRKNTKNLNTKISKLNEELSDSENNLYHYKIGLSQVEAGLVEFKTQEIKLCEKIRGLERDVEHIQMLEGLFKENQQLELNLEFQGFPLLIWETREKLLRPQLVGFRDLNKTLLKKDSGCSRHMTGNISYISEYEPYDGGYVSFGQGGGKITDKGKDFKLKDDTNVLLRTPRQHNMYSIDLNNVVPHKNLTCLVAQASVDESMLWHRRLGHLNFKTMNKLIRNNLVKGLPSKYFKNDHTCVDCLKGKQHKASCKTKLVNSMSKPLHTLYIDLFGPTSVSSLNHKWYCLVVTGDFSRFTWTFFLRTKDETSGILRNFITKIENLKDLKVKIIRCDNGGEFKNKEMNELCTKKGIKREFSNARTPRQNGVTERRNKTLIKAARTMLADAKLPVTFWAEAVNTAFYVQNRVLVNKSQNKTPYELFNSRTPAIEFLRLFRCHVMILNTFNHLGKFDAKRDEAYFVGYFMSSKAFRVFNKRTKKVEENLHVDFLENKLIGKKINLMAMQKQIIVATSTTKAEYVAVASGCGQVLWIQNQMLDYELAFCNYQNMIVILEKIEQNIDFHQIVDFLEASHIRIETTNEETKILSTVVGKPNTISKSSLRRHLKLNDEEGITSLPDTELFENLSLMGYNILQNQRFTFKKGQFSHQWKFLIHTIMQCLSPKSTGFNEFTRNIATDVVCLATNRIYNFSKMIFDGMVRNITNEHPSLLRDSSQGEAFPTISSLDARHDRENINKTFALPHESSPRVTSLDADEGRCSNQTGEYGDREEVRVERSTELESNDTEEMVNVLSSMEAANILTSRVAVVSVSHVAAATTVGVHTVGRLFPTISAIFTIASVVTPYSRRQREISAKAKGKEKVMESEVPKKRKLQEQIDAYVAREMEEEFARDNKRLTEQLVRDSEIARLHAEEELKMMIEGLDRSNEMIAKHLQEYEQAAADVSIRENIKLINELVKYQDHHAKILKYLAQQSKRLSKKEQREFYMSVLKSHVG
uniref:Ribonuclease H-like domain-containing protein n=1 Tax=Tanacetum cinerariifolium TaxID=118510 RepID=A0A6L2LKP3_TANCI|nr:ribonuclease H-like domain-containing protein [Tanacetum cinerariifolium]